MRKILFTLILMVLPISGFADSKLNHCLSYKELIESILISENVSTDYFYLAVCESGCKIKTSNKGAKGFFQLMPNTFKHFNSIKECTINDIECNTRAAAKYIKHLENRFKKISTLIKAYNMGGTNYQRYGPTTEANNLSYCVMSRIKHNKT